MAKNYKVNSCIPSVPVVNDSGGHSDRKSPLLGSLVKQRKALGFTHRDQFTTLLFTAKKR